MGDKGDYCWRDFHLFLDAELDAKGGRPTLRKRSVAELISVIERFTLVDVWRVRNQNKRRYTFHQSHQAGYLQRRLDYFFVSNSLQENICETDIQVAFCTDHSPITFSRKPINNLPRGRSLWKFNNSLLQNDECLRKMKTVIVETEQQLDSEQIKDDQVRWEYLKFKIRDQTIAFSKVLSANKRKEIFSLERKLLSLEKETEFQESESYINTKKELDNIYDQKAEGIRIRSRCKWYEAGEKSTHFFLNLEKRHAQESFITSLYENGELINNNTGIERKIFDFYSNLYQEKSNLLPSCIDNFLQSIDLPKLKEQEIKNLEQPLSEKEFQSALRNMPNEKSPGNDGLTKEFYETFWDDIKRPLTLSFRQALKKGELSTSQKQAAIKLIEKKGKDKRMIENWRPMPLLNVDLKIFSKAVASRLRTCLDTIISSEQCAYVEGRFISQNGRLIYNILEACELFGVEGYLVTVDIQKAFDSINHCFLQSVLKRYGFGGNLIHIIKTLLKNQESSVINGGKTAKYFPLRRGARQDDPVSAYLFILVLEVVFRLIKSLDKINGLEIKELMFLYSAYADDTTFLLVI